MPPEPPSSGLPYTIKADRVAMGKEQNMTCARLLPLLGCMVLTDSLLSASVLIAGTSPDSSGAFEVANSGASGGAFSFEQLFNLTNPAQVTSIAINAASFSDQTLEVRLYSGLGLEGTGTLLETFDLSIPGTFDGTLTDIPTIPTATSFMLGSGSYSLLFTDASAPTSNLIYLNAADGSNTPDGSLGGTHW
jgi:hypothetical protein